MSDRRPPTRNPSQPSGITPTLPNVVLVGSGASACIALIVCAPVLSPALGVVLVALSTGVCLLLLRAERLGRGPTLLSVTIAVGAVIAVAVILEPRTSHDLWTYVMYGRTTAVHHASPYTHIPADFPSDHFLSLVSARWHHTRCMYGPAFVGYASLGALITGDSALAARLFHQLVAAGALAGILIIVWRRTRSPAALAMVGLHPAIAVAALNGGHMDLLLGLMILVGTLLARRERAGAAGVLLGVAILLKVTACLAPLGLGIWLLRRRGVAAATRLVLPAAAVTGLGYLAAGPAAVTALGANAGAISRASVWRSLLPLIGRSAGAFGASRATVGSLITTVGPATVVLVAAVLAWRVAGRGDRGESILVATATYGLAAEYTLPWYASWWLPLAALRPRSRLARLLVIQSGLLAAAYELPRGTSPIPWLPGARMLSGYIVPVGLLAAFIWVAATKKRAEAPMTVES